METESAIVSTLSKLTSFGFSKRLLTVVSVLIITAAAMYYAQLEHDCNSVMKSGRWEHNHWHPYYCILQPQLPSGSVEKCLSGNSARRRVLLLGSTSLANTFVDIVDIVNNSNSYDLSLLLKKERALSFSSHQHEFKAEYFWTPTLDGNALLVYNKLMTEPPDNMSSIVIVHQHPGFQPAPPDVVLRNLGDAVKMCKERISALVNLQKRYLEMQQNTPYSIIIMIIAELTGADITLEIPKQCQEFAEQEYEALRVESKAAGNRLIMLKLPKYLPKPNGKTATAVEVVMHFVCNSRRYGTCCLAKDAFDSVVLLPLFSLLIAVQLGMWLVKITGGTLPLEPYLEGIVDLDKFFVILGLSTAVTLVSLYALLCDKIEVFFKQSPWSSSLFICLVIIPVSCFGLLKTDRHSGGHAGFFPKELSVEAKGWLVLVLMATEYFGKANSGPWRLVLAMFVFLDSLSHCQYFWNTGDFSLLRVAKILLRRNYLCVWMCLILHTPYFLYALPSLTTVSFLLVYLLMTVYPTLTAEKIDGASPTTKIAIAAKLALAGFLLLLFTLRKEMWSFPFLTTPLGGEVDSFLDSSATFHYGVRYVPLLAIITCYHLASIHSTATPSMHTKLYSIVLCLGTAGYFMVILMVPRSLWGQVLQDVLVVFPVLSYITARTRSERFRNSYSVFYHYCGTIANELYITFHHVMLVQGGAGIVAIFPCAFLVNLLSTLVLWLLCVQFLGQAVHAVRNYSLPSPTKQENSRSEEGFLAPA